MAAREDAAPQREDFSDLVAKKAREQKRKAESKAAEKNKRQKDKVRFPEHRRCGRLAVHGRWLLAAGGWARCGSNSARHASWRWLSAVSTSTQLAKPA